jgi:Holliday junction resolvase RusA-like endonuclease
VVRSKGSSKFPITYTPKTTVERERQIATEYKQQCAGTYFDSDVALKVYAEFLCPGRGPDSSIRGDIDNYAKAVLDALNSVAYHSDIQVVDKHARKRRAKRGEQTGAYIVIEPASEVQSALFETNVMPWEKTA